MHDGSQHADRPGHWRILRHEEPGGSAHYDLLIWPLVARPDPSRPLACFRLPIETEPLPHDGACRHFLAEPIADHRARYLTYEGELTVDRGLVSEVSAGEDADLRTAGGGLELTIGGRQYVGSVGGQGPIRFVRVPDPGS